MLKEWIESAKALYRMYRALARHKINRTEDSEEYKIILSLLEDAIKFEQQKIQELNFTPDTIMEMYTEIADYCIPLGKCESPNVYLYNDDFVAIARIYKVILRIDAELSKVDFPSEQHNLLELIVQLAAHEDYREKKLQEFYYDHVMINIIYVLSLAEKNTSDERTRELLIRLMYHGIFISPSYENSFKVTKTIQKPITIADYMYEVKELYKHVTEEHIEQTLIGTTHESFINVLKLSDSDLDDDDKYSNYVKEMIEVLARLISLRTTDKLDEVIDKFEKDIKGIDTQEKTIIVNDIHQIFITARKILTNKNKGKELSYGSTSKESNR